MSVREANALIEKFIYSCSHELRGPLLSIQGLVQIAGQSESEEERRECLAKINACSVKMDKLIRSLQEYLINEAHENSPQQVDADELLNRTMQFYQDELSHKGVVIEKEVLANAPWFIDQHEIFQIIRHVVGNAIAFSDAGKSSRVITVRIKVSDGEAEVEVRDNGIGMQAGSEERIFEIFERAHVTSGAGIGLFLVKQLVEKNNGHVMIFSEEGAGTLVKMKFPNSVTA